VGGWSGVCSRFVAFLRRLGIVVGVRPESGAREVSLFSFAPEVLESPDPRVRPSLMFWELCDSQRSGSGGGISVL